MKIAFISDIHSNLEALETVLADLTTEGVDRVVCLGDIVGYGPDPNDCVARVEETCAATVLGNHDQAALGELSTEYFNEYARLATEWTSRSLSPPSRQFLSSLPYSMEFEGLRLTHASPLGPENWTYVLTLEEAKRQFGGYDERLCFIGHSHLPIVLEEEGDTCEAIRYPADETLELLPDRRYIVNVGSVGQPRDRDPRSAYVWYDTAMDVLRLRRLDYAVDTVQRKIIDAGLPAFLASRLAQGM
jgi:diadenosine tetraphosphatase ApaH/serine/threonine PP2A family protein phosphatase